jgi:hypothetical protein
MAGFIMNRATATITGSTSTAYFTTRRLTAIIESIYIATGTIKNTIGEITSISIYTGTSGEISIQMPVGMAETGRMVAGINRQDLVKLPANK